jgi:hypothetical protein
MARKRRQEVIHERYLDKLRTLGIAVDHPAPELVPQAVAQLGKERETDLAVVFFLGRITDRLAAVALASLETTAQDKELKRQIRRALYRLAQKGIEAPESRAEQTVTNETVVKLGPEVEGYLSGVDGAGIRMGWLVKPQVGGGLILLEGLMSDREGLLQVGGMRIRRKDLREMMEESKQKHRIQLVSVPWEYVDQLLYEGFEKANAVERKGLEEFTRLRSLFMIGRPKSGAHPVYKIIDTESAHSGAWRSLSQRLLEASEFQTWVLDRAWIGPYLKRVEDAQESRLVLNQQQKEERVAAIVRTAVEEIFSGEAGPLYCRRLEDMALFLAAAKRPEEAKLALAVALALQERDWGGLGALDITFLTRLTQKSLAFYLSQEKTKAAEDPGLIVRP